MFLSQRKIKHTSDTTLQQSLGGKLPDPVRGAIGLLKNAKGAFSKLSEREFTVWDEGFRDQLKRGNIREAEMADAAARRHVANKVRASVTI